MGEELGALNISIENNLQLLDFDILPLLATVPVSSVQRPCVLCSPEGKPSDFWGRGSRAFPSFIQSA